jgi:hypothetical protein
LQGEGNIRKLRQALFHCPELYERIPMGKGRHYHVAEGPLFPYIILQDSTRHWTLHAAASSDAEMAEIFRRSLGMPVEFDMLSVNEWTQHLLCAERYGEGRVFIAGDAAHLVIPTGGLGMNTGVGDAVDLSWKLAATLAGWGGPQLLASYEKERRPIGLRNVKASRAAMSGRLSWRAAYHPDIGKDKPEGAAIRAEMAKRFDVEQRKVTEILGIEAGYRYVNSPIVWPESESGDGPDPDNPQYVPTTWPGARLPHVWVDRPANSDNAVSSQNLAASHKFPAEHNCIALHDCLGSGYSLLRLGGARADSANLERALRATGATLDVFDVADESAREIYGCDLLLVRPDLHIVWRGSRIADEAEAIASAATGRIASGGSATMSST